MTIPLQHLELLPEEGFGNNREKIATHARHILYVKESFHSKGNDYWLLVDVLKPNDSAVHTYEDFFHLNTQDITLDPQTKRILSLNADRAGIAIIPVEDEGLSVKVIKGQIEPFVQGWIPSHTYEMLPVPTPVFKRSSEGITYFIYVFCPIPKGGKLHIQSVKPVSLSYDTISVKVFFDDGSTDTLQVGQIPGVRRQ